MPKVIEGRKRGNGVGTMGIVCGGYQRRGQEDNKTYWPEPSQTPAAQPQNQSTTSSASLLPQEQDEEEKQAMIAAAKRAFQRRKPRKRKSAGSGALGGIVSDSFEFGSSKPKQKSRQSLTPQNHASDRAHPPLITPAGSALSLAEFAEASARDTAPWHSPRPHIQQHPSNAHEQQLKAMEERHRLAMEEQIRHHKQKMEEQIQKHKLEIEAQKEKHNAAIKDLVEKHAQSCQTMEEEHAQAMQVAVEQARKEKEEEHTKLLKETVEKLEAKQSASENAQKEEHDKLLTDAGELERSRITSSWDEEKKNQARRIAALQQELETYKKALCLESDQTQQQKAAELRERKAADLEEATSFFSQSGDDLLSFPLMKRFPLVRRLNATISLTTQHPFRSSARTFELSRKVKSEDEPAPPNTNDNAIKPQPLTDAATAAVLLELNKNLVKTPSEAKAKQSIKPIKSEPDKDLKEKPPNAVDEGKRSKKGVPTQPSKTNKRASRAKSPPPRRVLPARRTSPRKRLHEILPSFHAVPAGVSRVQAPAPKTKKRKRG